MPRTKLDPPPKGLRQKWSEESMLLGVNAVLEGRSLGEAASAFNLPKATLYRKVALAKEARQSGHEISYKSTLGRKPVLPAEVEETLVSYCLDMDRCFLGLTMKDIRRMACQLADANQIPTPFKNDQAGRDWLDRFLRKHPTLSVRKPENTSLARVRGFNQESVSRRLRILEKQCLGHQPRAKKRCPRKENQPSYQATKRHQSSPEESPSPQKPLQRQKKRARIQLQKSRRQ